MGGEPYILAVHSVEVSDSEGTVLDPPFFFYGRKQVSMEHRNLEWPTNTAMMQETCHEIPVFARPHHTAWVMVSNGNPNRKDNANWSRVDLIGSYTLIGS